MDDVAIQIIASKLESLHGDVGDMKSVLKELTTAVTKLAIVEERQGQASLALERAFKALEKVEAWIETLEVRLSALEKAAPAAAQTSTWVNNAMWAAAAVAATFIAKKVGLM